MKNLIVVSLLLILFTHYESYAQKTKNYSSDNLKITEISNNVFVHKSYLTTKDYGKVASNGMIYFNNNEAIVFDTPTNNSASKELISWIITNQKKTLKMVVITHFHIDCLGGLEAFHEKQIPSYANNKTIKLAKKDRIKVRPKNGFNKNITFKIGVNTVLVKFFGEGHTKDNVVGYITNENVLFGGCLVKTLKGSKGYLSDSNINQWSKTVLKIKNEFPNIKIVIPGHGKHGNTSLLDYTINLFHKKRK